MNYTIYFHRNTFDVVIKMEFNYNEICKQINNESITNIKQQIIENKKTFVLHSKYNKQNAIYILLKLEIFDMIWEIYDFEEDKDNDSIIKMILSIYIFKEEFAEFSNLINNTYIKRKKFIRRSILVEASHSKISKKYLLDLLLNHCYVTNLDNNNIIELIDFWLNLIKDNDKFISDCLYFHKSRLPNIIFDQIKDKLTFTNKTVLVLDQDDFSVIIKKLKESIPKKTMRLIEETNLSNKILVDVGNKIYDSMLRTFNYDLLSNYTSDDYLLIGHKKHFTNYEYPNSFKIPNTHINDDLVILYLSLKYKLFVITNDKFHDHFIVNGQKYIKLNEIWNDFLRIGSSSSESKFTKYYYDGTNFVLL